MAVPPLTPEELFLRLDALGIAHRTYSHPPVFTVAEATALRGRLPGGHCKSLFLKDKKGGFWLAVMLEKRRVDLKRLAVQLRAPRFSFGGAADLYEVLGGAPRQRDTFCPAPRSPPICCASLPGAGTCRPSSTSPASSAPAAAG